MATIVMAAAVVIVFTALWIGELVSPPVTLRMPHQAFATAGPAVSAIISNHSVAGGYRTMLVSNSRKHSAATYGDFE
jgi:hypothetical protein